MNKSPEIKKRKKKREFKKTLCYINNAAVSPSETMGNCSSYNSDDGFAYHPDDDLCEHCNCPIPPGNLVGVIRCPFEGCTLSHIHCILSGACSCEMWLHTSDARARTCFSASSCGLLANPTSRAPYTPKTHDQLGYKQNSVSN